MEEEAAEPLSRNRLLELQAIIADANGDYPFDEMPSSPASLLHSLSLTMDSGGKIGLLASNVYLSLILCTDSPVYSFFTPVAFLSFLRSLRLAVKGRQTEARPSQPNRRNDRKKKAGRSSSHVLHQPDEEEAQAEEENEAVEIEDLVSVLAKLDSVVGRVSLERFSDSLKSLIEAVVQVLVVAAEFENETSGKVRKLSYRRPTSAKDRLPGLCFKIFVRALHPQHGDVTNNCVEVLKSLSPLLVSQNSQIRCPAIEFVTSNLTEIAKEWPDVRRAMAALPRYLAVKSNTDKIDSRAVAVDAVMKVVQSLGSAEQYEFAGFVVKMSVGKVRLRMMAIDLIVAVLGLLPDPLGIREDGFENDDARFCGLRCLEALINRCSDKVAGIRARALSNLAHAVELLSADIRNRSRLMEALAFGNGSRAVPNVVHKDNLESFNSEMGNQGLFFNQQTISPDFGPGPTPLTPGAFCRDLNALVRRRCVDDKAAVRKAALLLITKSTVLLGRVVDESVVKTIGLACSDPLVSIRKAALSALSEVFRRFADNWVITEWLRSVPQMILDNESSIQTECENMFLELVLDRISRAAAASKRERFSVEAKANLELELESIFPEGVLLLLKEMSDVDVSSSVKKVCRNLGKKGKITAAVALALQNIITTSESLWLSRGLGVEKWVAPAGAWMLLSIISEFLPKAVGWKFLQHHWQLLDKPTDLQSNAYVTPLSNSNNRETDEPDPVCISWAGDRVFLLQTISNVALELPPEAAANLAHDLLSRLEAFDMHPTEVDAHVQALTTLCKRKSVNSTEGDMLVSKWVEQLLAKALTLLEKYLSEVSQAKDTNNFQTPSRCSKSKRKGKRHTGTSSSTAPSQAATAVFTVGSLILVCPSADLKGIIPLLQTIITSGCSEQRPKDIACLNFSSEQISPSLYIQAWVTMGKVCLADDKLAKRYIPLFVQELEKSDSAPLRNNIMMVMTDFCVRYITKITKSLRDPCEVVRRQTFILLSRLLQVRSSKAPLLAYNSFVEVIFLLNGCKAHAAHSELYTGQRLFTLRGSDDKTQLQRMHIYTLLLKQMAPEQLLATSAKLCAEILAAVADGLLNLNESGAQAVLKDALQVLACKEMRIQPSRGSAAAADATEMDEEPGNSNGTFVAAKGRVVSQVAKKNLVQNAIPIFIELKRLLESKNSPLTGCLMECLRTILKEYQDEIEEILVADKQLQKELIYDIQKAEEATAKSAVSEVMRSGPRSLTRQSAAAAAVSGSAGGHLKSGDASKVVSAVADIAASATANTVLKDVSNGVPTPRLDSMSIPRVKAVSRTNSSGGHTSVILESLRRRQTFDSDSEG
ncbi:Condensin-2 complex subunit D3 [Nymphaea thermarum]|nr:Condensin-2 complex subunit D3 [Nymphaea thermarum]